MSVDPLQEFHDRFKRIDMELNYGTVFDWLDDINDYIIVLDKEIECLKDETQRGVLHNLKSKTQLIKKNIENKLPNGILELKNELDVILSDNSDSEISKFENLGKYLVKLFEGKINNENSLLYSKIRKYDYSNNDFKYYLSYVKILEKKARTERNKSTHVISLQGF